MDNNKPKQNSKILNEDPKTENPEIGFKDQFDNLKKKFDKEYKPRTSTNSVPTYTPKNFFEQFVLYDDGTNQRLYVYINGGWMYASLS